MKENWETVPLGRLCQIEIGRTPSRGNNNYWDTEKATTNVWLSIADLLNSENNIVSESKEYISNEGAKISKIVEVGTLLVSFKLTLGRLAFAGRDLFTNEAIAALKVKNEKQISKKFLYYFLSYFDWQAATDGDIKVKGKALNKSKLSDINIQFPTSIFEQQRIVDFLDESFSAIDKAKENAEKNLQNSRELFDSYLQCVFANLGKRWEEKKLEEVVSEMVTGPFGSILHKSDYVTNGVPVINPQNIVNGQIIPLQKTMVNQKTRERLIKYSLQEKDIVIARRGEMGRCAIVTKDQVGWLCGTGSLLIRLKKSADENYVSLFLSSSKVKCILEKNSVGTTMSNLNQGILMQVTIPFPPLAEQQSIVAKLDALSSETKRLEAIYQQKLAALDELKKSVLQKAFNGELTGA